MSDYILKIIYEHFGVIAVCATVLVGLVVSFYPNIRLIAKDCIRGMKFLLNKLLQTGQWIRQKTSQEWEWVRVHIFRQLPKNSFAYFFRQSAKSRLQYIKSTIKRIGKRKYAKAQKIIKAVFIDTAITQPSKDELLNAIETLKPIWEIISQDIIKNEYDDLVVAQYMYCTYPIEAKILAIFQVVRSQRLPKQALYRIAYYYGFRQSPSHLEAVIESIGNIDTSTNFRYYTPLLKLNENFILAALTGDKCFVENREEGIR